MSFLSTTHLATAMSPFRAEFFALDWAADYAALGGLEKHCLGLGFKSSSWRKLSHRRIRLPGELLMQLCR